MVLLYPILAIVFEAGQPKIRKGTKVAANNKQATPEGRDKAPFNTGIKNELIPKANPIAKNIIPTNANGMAKFVLFCDMILNLELFAHISGGKYSKK